MKQYDIVIIGAGIHGAAVARHATAEGYKTLVIEQYPDAAQATSSRSSKLIHGGLRYLESAQFRLVRECLHERNTLLKTAASLVHLVPFYIPVYNNSQRSFWKIYSGLFLYKLLGGGKFKCIARCDWNKLDGIKTENLKAVFQYFDAQTDDAALTKVVLNDASARGCEVRMNSKVVAINRLQTKLSLANGEGVEAKIIINATGPWINEVVKKIQPVLPSFPVELVQGTHIIVKARLEQGIYYIEAADGRVVFMMPWQGRVMIGTTETPYAGEPADVLPQPTEINYLLQTWNDAFEDHLAASDVVDAFAGLRVLPASDKAAFSRSRDTQLITSGNIISIVGGKLTSHRHTAEQVMTIVHRRIKPERKVDTSVLELI